MFKALKRWWKYLGAKVNRNFEQRADPAVQLEQAITEAQDQHRKLREQAATVIANQKQLELRLNRSLEEYERVNANTRQALLMAEEASGRADADKATEYAHAAESFASRLVSLEREIEENKQMVLQASQAAEQAKSAVQQNSATLQRKLTERQKLLNQLDQAKMQEQLNSAMESLSETVGQDVPTFEQVRDKIEARYTQAKSMTELSGQSVEARMLEVEQASQNMEANARLAEIRAELGIAPAADTLGSGDVMAEVEAAAAAASASGELGEGSAAGDPGETAETKAQPKADPA